MRLDWGRSCPSRALSILRSFRTAIGVAFAVASLAAVAPSTALAQIVTLSPPLATNIAGPSATHTVTVNVSGGGGHCSDFGACVGGVDNGNSCRVNGECDSGVCNATGGPADDGQTVCTSDSDCQVADSDDYCAYNGFAVGVLVTGTNSSDSNVVLPTDNAGNASYTYSDLNGVGSDTIQACLDLGTDIGESTSECLAEVVFGTDSTDIASNTATKIWVPKVMISPASAYNPVGATHTVTAQVAGVCAETTSEVDSDGEGSPCVNDSQCLALDSAGADEKCDFSGVAGETILIGVVGGPNSGAFTTSATVDPNGQAIFQYSSSIPGVDTIQGCLDTEGPDENGLSTAADLAMCIADGPAEGDFPSNQVTKHWFTTPVVTLTPASSTNPASTASATSSHTVTAQVTGGKLGTCTAGTNIGAACDVATVATDCAGSNPVCDVSGFSIEFGVISGPNAGDLGVGPPTDVNGVTSQTYNDPVGVTGLDTIQSCLDVDLVSGDGGVETAASCIAESASDGADVPSNTVVKRWQGTPTVMLFNEDLAATLVAQAINPAAPPVFTKADAFNPVGSSHTVEAVVSGGKLGICTNAGPHFDLGCDVATAATDCASPTSTAKCDASGLLVGFTVLPGGQNPGDFLPTTWVNTDMNGVAIDSYTDTNGAGKDLIEACLDTDTSGSNDENAGVASCIADAATTEFGDYATNEVTKYWLSKFVTGGGKVVIGKTWDTFGGVVGQKPGSLTALTGEWQQQAHAAKGGNTQCHWNTFTKFALSCSIANCGTQPNTVVFTTGPGPGTCGSETVQIIDGQKKPDTIQVIATNPALNVPASSLVSGNFTIHK